MKLTLPLGEGRGEGVAEEQLGDLLILFWCRLSEKKN